LISFSNEVVTAAAFDPLGRRLALASTLRLPGGAAIRVIDLESNSTTLLQPRSRQPISEVTFSPNGQWLAAAFWDDTLAPGCAEIWRVADGGSSFSEAGVLDHLDGVLSVAFSGSSELIATASEDQTANVWSRTNETWQFSLRPFYCGGEVYACAFSHNGRWLATANRTPKAQGAKRWSSEIRIWDVVNSEPVGLPIAIYDRVTRLVFLGNGGRLFVERWQPPAAPERWIVDLVSQNDRGAHKGLTQEFLLQTELLSAQRSFLSGRTPHLSRALEGSISAEEAMSRATSVGQLRPLSKEDCRELWHHLSSARLPTGTGQSE
jgi:WD40 repeat protein